jgi:hypothetical protein
MGKAVHDSRPARAVLSAPYPLPIVITRTHSASYRDPIPIVAVNVPPITTPQADGPFSGTRSDGSFTPQREKTNRLLNLRRRARKLQGGEETEWDLMSGILEEEGVAWTGRPFADHSRPMTTTGLESQLLQQVTGMDTTVMDEIVEEIVELPSPSSANASLYFEEADEEMVGEDSDAVSRLCIDSQR